MGVNVTRLIAGVLLLTACSTSQVEPTSDARPNAELGVPPITPSLVGVVVSVDERRRLLLEHRPERALCDRQALASVAPDARVVRRNGSPATAADVRVGQRVTVWFGDVALRSCPVQIAAVALVIEP